VNASSSGYGVGEFLSGLSDDVMAVRIPTAESIWGPGDDPKQDYGCTYFRLPMHRRIARPLSALLYGDIAKFHRRGLLAHSAGNISCDGQL
jgi:hypothetical protein